MPHEKQTLKGGAEYDWIGSWRRAYCYLQNSGVGKSIKRGMNKRARHQAKAEARLVAYDELANHTQKKSPGGLKHTL